MSRKAILLPLTIFAVFMALSVTLISSCTPPTSGTVFGDRIGLLYVEGVIMSGNPSSSMFFGATGAYSDHIVQVVEQAIQDKGIKAIVVRVNSPGGSAAASQEIYTAFKKFSDSGRPLIVSMADVAASGGYYIASPADEIYANASTLTGSIGVIMQLMNYEGLYEIIGFYDTTIKAGKFKDIGSPTRPMTDEEKQLLQDMLDQTHQQFKQAVMDGRGFTQEEIDKIATGMIYNGQQALDNKLVDKIGGLQDAIARASELTGLGDNPQIDELGKVGLFEELLGEMGATNSTMTPNQLSLLNQALQQNGMSGGNGLTGANGVMGDVGQALAPLSGGNPFYSLWSMILLDPRLVGNEAGVRY